MKKNAHRIASTSKKQTQLTLFKRNSSAYGGSLLKTRKGRGVPRPLAVRQSMHLTLRSSLAMGAFSFRRPQHSRKIDLLIKKFAAKYKIRIHSYANVGNHLHLHLQLTYRDGYKPFIRALTGAIAMAVTGASRWTKTRLGRFWDRRPFTRIVFGRKDFSRLERYVRLNQMEGRGYTREVAKIVRAWQIMNAWNTA